MKINVNDKVLISSDNEVIGTYNGEVATVKRIYPDVVPPIAYVEIDADLIDRTIGLKVPIADLVLIPDEPKSEIPEGAREITKDDFDEALKEVTSPDSVFSNGEIDPIKAFFAGMRTMIVGRKISEKLFENQSITVTEDQFIDALWNACSPVDVSEIIDRKMSVRNCVHISAATMRDLLGIVPVFFGGEAE